MNNPHATRCRCWKCKGMGEAEYHNTAFGAFDAPCGVCDGTGEDAILTLARAAVENPGDAFALDSLREEIETIDSAIKRNTLTETRNADKV